MCRACRADPGFPFPRWRGPLKQADNLSASESRKPEYLDRKSASRTARHAATKLRAMTKAAAHKTRASAKIVELRFGTWKRTAPASADPDEQNRTGHVPRG